jgi:peptide/nickel transport system permease protein
MLNLLKGDLGKSEIRKVDVWSEFIQRLPNTLVLAFTSLLIGATVSIPLGIFASRHAGSIADNAVTVFSLIGMSMPIFWLGLLLLLLFSYRLGWLPAGGNREGVRSIILPAICGSLGMIANTARQTRSNMLEVLHADFLRTARAKGVPEKKVINYHAFRNTLIPLVTIVGGSLPGLFSGALFTETMFSLPGIGYTSYNAMIGGDIPFSMFYRAFLAILTLIGNLISDILYAVVDPRVRLA